MGQVTVLLLVLAAAALLVGVSALARRADARRQRELGQEMDGLVTERGRATLDEIALFIDQNKHVLGRYHTRSREFREAGAYEDAVKWMGWGCEAIEKLAPDLVSALTTMRKLARTVSVIVSLPPLRPYAFRAWQTRGLIGLGAVLHHLLITGQERIRLRLRLLIRVFGMTLRWLRRSTDRVTARPQDAAEWQRIDDLVSDVATANDEAQLTVQRVVQALDAGEFKKQPGQQSRPTQSVGLP
jgi:hypothetical protein